jgi:hypothetical protein
MLIDFSRLSRTWAELAPKFSEKDVSVDVDCADCEIFFRSSDNSVHLRRSDDWWLVDTVNDRGQRSDGKAQFSTFSLAEKYLIWDWVTSADSNLAYGPLGGDLYAQGYAAEVEVSDLGDYQIKVCFREECAVLFTGTATIFSHVMKFSLSEIEKIANIKLV